MGLQEPRGLAAAQDFFLETIEQFDTAARGNPHWLAIQFMKTMKVDLTAAGLLLGASPTPRTIGSAPSPCRPWW